MRTRENMMEDAKNVLEIITTYKVLKLEQLYSVIRNKEKQVKQSVIRLLEREERIYIHEDIASSTEKWSKSFDKSMITAFWILLDFWDDVLFKGYYNGNSVMEGNGFLIYPGQLEEYCADTSNPWEFLWIISSDSAMKEIFSRYSVHPDTLIFEYDSVPVVKKIANEIISKNNEVLDSLKMLEIFLHILNSHIYKQFALQHKPNSETYLDFCVDYIESNIHKKITVEELSELLGVSQPYLYKLFSNKFNISTKQYITWHKINYAKKLLIETDMSITEIANSVGYNDILAFSKMFSSKEKISPQKYRICARDKV